MAADVAAGTFPPQRRPCSVEQRGRSIAGLKFICTDMWQQYMTVIAEKAASAVHILDRYQVMKKFGDKLNKVRAEEARQRKDDGYEPVLKNSRWCLLKRPENLTSNQRRWLGHYAVIEGCC